VSGHKKPLFLLKYCSIKDLKEKLSHRSASPPEADKRRTSYTDFHRFFIFQDFVMQILKSERRRRIPHRHIQLSKEHPSTGSTRLRSSSYGVAGEAQGNYVSLQWGEAARLVQKKR